MPILFNSVLLQIDNAPAHTARNTRAYLASAVVEMVKQSPYSPDLYLCDRFLFRSIKKHFESVQINCEDDVKSAASEFLKHMEVDALQAEVNKLIKHCNYVIERNGSYVDCSKYNC